MIALENPTRLEGVVRVVDTRTPGLDLGSAAVQVGDEVVAWHVTDDPEPAARAIDQDALVRAYGSGRERRAELGPGLYASASPQLWLSRARGKWDFLKRLRSADVVRLATALRGELADRQRFITSLERAYAERDIEHVLDGAYDSGVLVNLANQPYNIPFWRPEWLARIGVDPGATPQVVEVGVVGRLAELRDYPTAATLRALRRVADGAYVRGSMAALPQIVVWNGDAVTYFGPER